MALSNNEKQIRHKRLETLKKYGSEVLVHFIFMNNGPNCQIEKSNEEIKAEIESIVNLPSGWTDEDYHLAMKKIENLDITLLSNPDLMNNDIYAARNIFDSKIDLDEQRKALSKAPEVVRNIKSTLKLSELKVTDQIAVIAEVMRFLGTQILYEKSIPRTYANATALSMIDQNYEKPAWTWEVLAKNLYVQNSKDKAELIAEFLTDSEIENKGKTGSWGSL